MVLPNVLAFIGWGLLTALFIPLSDGGPFVCSPFMMNAPQQVKQFAGDIPVRIHVQGGRFCGDSGCNDAGPSRGSTDVGKSRGW